MNLPSNAAQPNLENSPFFEGALQEKLVLPKCKKCEFVIWFPREICRRIPGSWSKATPFVLAYVELDEGPRVMTNIVDCDLTQIRIGDRVEKVFEEAVDRNGENGPPLLRFRPTKS